MNETSAVSLSHFHKHKLDFEANCGRERRMKNNLDIMERRENTNRGL